MLTRVTLLQLRQLPATELNFKQCVGKIQYSVSLSERGHASSVSNQVADCSSRGGLILLLGGE